VIETDDDGAVNAFFEAGLLIDQTMLAKRTPELAARDETAKARLFHKI
jgi:hypothetical protein